VLTNRNNHMPGRILQPFMAKQHFQYTFFRPT